MYCFGEDYKMRVLDLWFSRLALNVEPRLLSMSVQWWELPNVSANITVAMLRVNMFWFISLGRLV
jgi:hypothetical protein